MAILALEMKSQAQVNAVLMCRIERLYFMANRTYNEEEKEEAQKVVSMLSRWVNCMTHDNQLFVQAVLQEHRTLQQQMFEVMLACIEAWAKTEHFDLRNEFNVQKCKQIMELLPGGAHTPFI